MSFYLYFLERLNNLFEIIELVSYNGWGLNLGGLVREREVLFDYVDNMRCVCYWVLGSFGWRDFIFV